MINSRLIIQVISFFLYVIVQVLLMKNIVLFDRVFIFFYIGFLLLLPIETGVLLMLIIGFFTGLTVDIFYNSFGIHAFACVLIMFVRNYWLNLITPQGGYEIGSLPTVKLNGWQWFSIYSLPLVLLHHIVLFYIEAAGFNLFGFTLVKVISSTIFTFIILMIVQYLFYNTRGRKWTRHVNILSNSLW